MHCFAARLQEFADRYKREPSSVALIKYLRQSLNAARRVRDTVVQYDDCPGHEIFPD